jgi:KaiC/GvpD/RAD55 family RecA-like ATPase
MKKIPKQLRRKEFSFAKLVGKNPNVGGASWQNQRHSWEEAEEWLANGYNYGVMGGIGGVIIIDGDSQAIIDAVLRHLPTTFTILTGSGKMHFYFFCSEIDKKVIFNDNLFPSLFTDEEIVDSVMKGKDPHYGEIIVKGFQAVGPGSIHPDTKKEYEVLIDEKIVSVTKEQVFVALAAFLRPDKPEILPKEAQGTGIDALKITDVLPQVTNTGNIVHPVHGATGAGNLNLDVEKNLWHCFRCDSGGGPVSLFAVMEGLIDCSEAKGSFLRGAKFLEIKKKIEESFPSLFPAEEGTKKSKTITSNPNFVKTTSEEDLNRALEVFLNGKSRGVSTGFPELDKFTGGLIDGQSYLIYADTNVGKSVFAANILASLAMSGVKCVYFDLENSMDMSMERLMFATNNGSVCLINWREAKEKKDVVFINQCLLPLRGVLSNLKVWDLNSLNERFGDITWVGVKKCILEAIEEGVQVIVLDHLHYFSPSETDHAVLGEVARELNNISAVNGIVVLAVAHTKKGLVFSGKDGNVTVVRPNIDSINGSSLISKHFKNIVALSRNVASEEKGVRCHTSVYVDKTKYGPAGKFTIEYREDSLVFLGGLRNILPGGEGKKENYDAGDDYQNISK